MREPRKFVLLVCVAFCVASCSLAPPPRTTVNVISDKFSQAVTIEGLPQDEPFEDNDVFWMLRSFVYPRTRSAQHEIYVEWFFPGHGGGRYFAADDTARPLPVKLLLRENCGRECGQTDKLSIAIDEATLRARAATGFQVKLSETDGSSYVLTITPSMIGAQLQAESQVLGGAVALPEAVAGAGASAAGTPPEGPRLGISFMPFSASQVNPVIYADGGLMIIIVAPDSPAAKAGIKSGDVLLSFDGMRLNDPAAARGIIARAKAGTIVPLEIQRGTERLKLQAHF